MIGSNFRFGILWGGNWGALCNILTFGVDGDEWTTLCWPTKAIHTTLVEVVELCPDGLPGFNMPCRAVNVNCCNLRTVFIAVRTTWIVK
jgi:hypothetical protein